MHYAVNLVSGCGRWGEGGVRRRGGGEKGGVGRRGGGEMGRGGGRKCGLRKKVWACWQDVKLTSAF